MYKLMLEKTFGVYGNNLQISHKYKKLATLRLFV